MSIARLAICLENLPGEDNRVNEFLNRPLVENRPCIWLDPTCLKLRHGWRIVRFAGIIPVAANTDGHREIIDLGLGPSERKPSGWDSFAV